MLSNELRHVKRKRLNLHGPQGCPTVRIAQNLLGRSFQTVRILQERSISRGQSLVTFAAFDCSNSSTSILSTTLTTQQRQNFLVVFLLHVPGEHLLNFGIVFSTAIATNVSKTHVVGIHLLGATHCGRLLQ